MKCSECKFWKRETIYNNTHQSIWGKCDGLPNHRMEIEIDAGWDGGVVRDIETDEDWFCASFEKKDRLK